MKIIIINNIPEGIWRLRRELIVSLVYNGHDVSIIVPDGHDIDLIEKIGAKVKIIPSRRFVSPINDLKYIWLLYRFIGKVKPDIVFTMTAKQNIYGCIIARLRHVKRIAAWICGSGIGFSNQHGTKLCLLQNIIKYLYSWSGYCADIFLFQNEDDQKNFIVNKIIPKEKTHVIKSSGINLKQFTPELVDKKVVCKLRNEWKIDKDGIVVTMIGRITKSKGVLDFIEASRIVYKWGINAKFILVGKLENGTEGCISEKILQETDHFIWINARNDIREILAATDIVTLPSYFNEGVPRTLLEGMAMHKPIITTDHIGCRETVDEGINGFKIPVRNPMKLAESIKKLSLDSALRFQFGIASYEKVKREFTMESVNKRILEDVLKLTNVKIPQVLVETQKNYTNIVIK